MKFLFLIMFLLSCSVQQEFKPLVPPEFSIKEWSDNSIVLEWDHVDSTNLAGYFIYWGVEHDYLRTYPKSYTTNEDNEAPSPITISIDKGWDWMEDAGLNATMHFKLRDYVNYVFFMQSYNNEGMGSRFSKVLEYYEYPGPKVE